MTTLPREVLTFTCGGNPTYRDLTHYVFPRCDPAHTCAASNGFLDGREMFPRLTHLTLKPLYLWQNMLELRLQLWGLERQRFIPTHSIPQYGQFLEAALIENPPPSLENVAKRLGCPAKNIQYYFPELAKAITQRRRAMTDGGSQQKELEGILARDEHTLSLEEVARRLGTSSDSLRKRFPELCATISERHKAFRKNRHEERIKRICDEVRRVTLSIHSRGDYPSKTRVGALLRSPACFRMPEVRNAWRETMQELGYAL